MYRDKKEHDEMHGYWIGLGGKIDIENGETGGRQKFKPGGK